MRTKKEEEFVNDLKAVFEKHGAYLCVDDVYGDEECYLGTAVCIRSRQFVGDELEIFIDDMDALSSLVEY